MSRLPVLLLFLFALVGIGCTRVRVEDARGPGGTDWKLITCSRLNKKCYRAAQKMCPDGYYFARAEETSTAATVSREPGPESGRAKVTTLPPQESWRGGMYSKKPGKLLVRCGAPPRDA
jgi:hypothetical protein